MTAGTAPQALVDYIESNWTVSRSGRPDVPPIATDPATDFGVLVSADRQEVATQRGVHDEIHCYHPEASPVQVEDRGFKEVQEVETVQIDIRCADRTDPDTGERLSARERMVGLRDDAAFSAADDAYPGLLGETRYILETARRDFNEWDMLSFTVIEAILKTSSARMSLDVQVEHVARNTVQ